MDRRLISSSGSTHTTRHITQPTFIGEIGNSLFSGKSFLLSMVLYIVGKPLFELVGREVLLVSEKIMDDEDQRLARVKQEEHFAKRFRR